MKGYSRRLGKAKREHSLTLQEGRSVAHKEKREHFSYLYHRNRHFASGKRLTMPASTQNAVTEPTSQEKLIHTS